MIKLNLNFISKNYFCTQKKVHKDWIHTNIIANNNERRLYNTKEYGCEQIFWNEIGQFFEYMISQNLKIYYVTNSVKHNIKYTDECCNFFKNNKNNFESINVPECLKQLREWQASDLMYFYDNLILESFWIISKIKNDKYYYDMIIIVKNDFNINNFYKINFNIINIETIAPIFYENVTYNYMQQLFDFNELNNYAFNNIRDQDFVKIIHDSKYKETLEYKNLKKYESEQFEIGNYFTMQHNNSLYWYYSNEYNGVKSQMQDQRCLFKHYLSNFGWQWFTLNYNFEDVYKVEPRNYTYPINEPFLLTLDNVVTPIAVVKQDGELQKYDEEYEFGCMFDLLDNLNDCDNYCISSYDISVPKIKYGTSYKCRLKKKYE